MPRSAGIVEARLTRCRKVQGEAARLPKPRHPYLWDMGFHAPQELARILGEVIDHARQGQLAAERAIKKE